MNVKSKIKTWLVLLALAYVPCVLHAAVKVETTNNSITASTNERGTKGYQGCDASDLQEVPAYVFILLSNGKADGKTDGGGTDDDPCGDKGPTDGGTKKIIGGWDEISRITSEGPQAIFTDLPEGRYRVEVLVGQAIGCQVNGGAAAMPAQSIVYLQEKTTPVILGNKAVAEETPQTKTGNLALNELQVFPNPTSNQLQIQLHHPELGAQTQITLYDLLGRALIVKKESTADAGASFFWTMDVGQFSDGAYLLVVEDEKGHFYQEKVIVQKD